MDEKLTLRDCILIPGIYIHEKQPIALKSLEKTKKKTSLLKPGVIRSAILGNSKGLFGVAKYLVKPYIPYIWRYFLDFLTSERHADEFRAQPLFPISQK